MMKKILAIALSAGLAIPVITGPVAEAQQRDPALEQTVTADEQIAERGQPVVISAGHIDLGPQMLDGELVFLARDDTSVPPIWRYQEDVVYEVSDTALTPVPEESVQDFSFMGAEPGSEVWVIPQTEVPGVPWLGWNTQSPSIIEVADRGITMEFAGHDGPGTFSLFLQQGGFEPPQVLWTSDTEGTQPMFIENNTHTHANWVFTEPGVHLVAIQIRVPLVDGTELTTTEYVRFAVGGVSPQEALNAEFSGPLRTEEAAEAEAEDAAAADQEEESNSTVIWITIGLVVLAIIVIIAAVAVQRAARRERDQAVQAAAASGKRSED